MKKVKKIPICLKDACDYLTSEDKQEIADSIEKSKQHVQLIINRQSFNAQVQWMLFLIADKREKEAIARSKKNQSGMKSLRKEWEQIEANKFNEND